ncbi:MAG: TIGR03032 family protein [Acidobacteriota bacterium]
MPLACHFFGARDDKIAPSQGGRLKLATEFVRLPIHFDAERLAAEVLALPESEWRPHPQGYPGNSALSLVSALGDPNNDATSGPMLPTRHLEHCPYVRQVLAAFNTPIGRTRLMRLDGNAEATAHADSNYYWLERVRIHVPVVTTPRVDFLCGSRKVNMAPGEAWIFDTWQIHNVLNPEPTRRIHLVSDSVGSAEFWGLVADGAWPFAESPRPGGPARFVPFRAEAANELVTERRNQPVVMTPWEQAQHRRALLAGIADSDSRTAGDRERFEAEIKDFELRWRALWARYGESGDGFAAYRAVLNETDRKLGRLEHRIRLVNGLDAVDIYRQWVLRPALHPELATDEPATTKAQPLPEAPSAPRTAKAELAAPRRFERPIFLVSPPRSGSSLLFETLLQSPDAWTIGGESHAAFEAIPAFQPGRRGWTSNRLTATDLRPELFERLVDALFLNLRDRDGKRPVAGAEALRLLEKTPKNALRVPFLAAAFPDARFVYLYRNPRETINSMYEAWESGRFVTYPKLPRWSGPPWSLALVEGWRELNGKSTPEIAARQWQSITETLVSDLEALPAERWCLINYGALVSEPQSEVERLCRFLDLGWDRTLTVPLPESRHTLTPPEAGKWRKNAELLEPVLPLVAATAERALAFFARRPGHLPVDGPTVNPAEPQPSGPHSAALLTAPAPAPPPPPAVPARAAASPLGSVHTKSLVEILTQLRSSLIVTTYQSGRVVLVRAAGERIDTQFSAFPSPMGVALGPRYLALGAKDDLWEFRNVPALGARLPSVAGIKPDACFLPRRRHLTGDIRVHEMAFAGEELWLVNTRFSCLCTLDHEHSFVPRWQPRFISALVPEDRCHLNGLAMAGGRPRYATALGTTDVAGGWRAAKADGGVLLDIESGEVVARGLSMPHSPRLYGGKLWVLESGKGEINTIDPATGEVTTVAQLPGFTRGLAFAGPFAFVGLSQVRESVFGGIPLAARVTDRVCGIWVVDLRSGQSVGFLRFEDAVQEIFDVQLLPGLRLPHLEEARGELLETTFIVPDESRMAPGSSTI